MFSLRRSNHPYLAFAFARRRTINQQVMKTFIAAPTSLGSNGWSLVSHKAKTNIIGKMITVIRSFRKALAVSLELFSLKDGR
jgi:hypothetical protein